jgi:hypothetical protein
MPPVNEQSCGANATPAASQRLSTLPVQLAPFGVQAAEPTGLVLG